ncbi:MAG: pre-peptidase C-terminal domain-containing protein, partial [Planctomycetales bacterium]|nr:pre-peptidase C-terminal domain-containing protein [Planctomycetales bacterium]
MRNVFSHCSDSPRRRNGWNRKRRARQLHRFRKSEVESLEDRILLAVCVDESEDNGVLAAATELPTTEDPFGSGYHLGCGAGSWGTSSDIDYWSIDLIAGDVVSVRVDATDGSPNPYVELRNSADGRLFSDNNNGLGTNAFLSHATIDVSGNYFLRVEDTSNNAGSYQVSVDIARGVQLETDPSDANSSINGAETLARVPDGLSTRSSVAGAISHANDQDYYFLGQLNVGNEIQLSTRIPSASDLEAVVSVVDGAGNPVADDDGVEDGAGQFEVTQASTYYAVIRGAAGGGIDGQYLLDVTVNDTESPQIVSVQGLPDEGVVTGDLTFTFGLRFDEYLESESVHDPQSFRLTNAGADDIFGTADDEAYAVAVEPTYVPGGLVHVVVTDGPLRSGRHRFEALPSLRDIVGNALDGNGDGVGGDAFTREFTVRVNGEPRSAPETEPNDALATAGPLEWIESPVGSGYAQARGIGTLDPSTDEDWWSFEGQEGDLISAAVDAIANGNLAVSLYLYNAAGTNVTADNAGGAYRNSQLSPYRLPNSGTYYIRVDYWTDSLGSYQLRVDRARGIDLENDRSYANDSLQNASPLTLAASGTSQVATFAGTIMDSENANLDEDYYRLGVLNAGNTVEFTVSLPSTSTLVPVISLVDSEGIEVADEDGDAEDAHFSATLVADGEYFIGIRSAFDGFAGSRYVLGPNLNWTDADAYAQSLGGHLVAITSQAEQDFLQRTFEGFDFWLGLNDQDVEGTHVWSSGEDVTYEHWAPGEPNTASRDGVYFENGDGYWYDYPVTSTLTTLVEIPDARVTATV